MGIVDLMQDLQTDDFDKLQEMHSSVEALYRLMEDTEGDQEGRRFPQAMELLRELGFFLSLRIQAADRITRP